MSALIDIVIGFIATMLSAALVHFGAADASASKPHDKHPHNETQSEQSLHDAEQARLDSDARHKEAANLMRLTDARTTPIAPPAPAAKPEARAH
jgi:hypothetical protein